MMRLFLLLALALVAQSARADSRMPDYLRDLDRPYHAGDWTLQCNSTQFCQILGVAKIPRPSSSRTTVRAIVMINRGIARNAKPVLRLAFVDSFRVSGTLSPGAEWRLYARGLPKMPPPIRLSLGQPEANGAYRAAPDVAAKVIHVLKRWPGSSIREGGVAKALMPRGNLARLLRKMDRLQHPKRPRMTAEDMAKWMKEYHYVTLRSLPADRTVPEDVLLSCDTRTYINRPEGVRVGPNQHLWTGDCPEGHKVFLQQDGRKPVNFTVRDASGKIRHNSYASFNSETSLLEMLLPKDGNDGCGHHIQFGFTGERFAMIDYRRYERCRMVPVQFWPIIWRPTSWKRVDQTPSNEGNAPPANEGEKAP